MKFAFAALAAFAACAVAAPARAGDPETWTLERLVAVSLEENPDAAAAQARLRGASAAYAEAASRRRPQLSLQGGYSVTNSPMMAFGSILNQRAFDFGLDFNEPGAIDNLRGAAVVGMNLYAGGKLEAGRRAARAGQLAAAQDEAAARARLALSVTQAYLDIRRAAEAVAAMDAGERAFEAAVSNAEARFEAGRILKAELLSLRAQLAQTREQRLQASHQQALAQRALLFLLGREATGEAIVLAESDASLAALAAPSSLDFSGRPELLALQSRERAAEAMVAAARGDRRPSVQAFASYQYDRGWESGSDGTSWTGGLAVDLNVFDGGAASARIGRAEAELSEIREYRRKAALGIGLEVEQARLGLEQARARIEATSAMLEEAEESAALSRARFEEGALLAAELIGVESRLIEAGMRRAFARADERLAVAALRRAVGAELFAEN